MQPYRFLVELALEVARHQLDELLLQKPLGQMEQLKRRRLLKGATRLELVGAQRILGQQVDDVHGRVLGKRRAAVESVHRRAHVLFHQLVGCLTILEEARVVIEYPFVVIGDCTPEAKVDEERTERRGRVQVGTEEEVAKGGVGKSGGKSDGGRRKPRIDFDKRVPFLERKKNV